MSTIAAEVGRALRRARLARGLTLTQVATLSADRFRPTSIAGYERGERNISLNRFCELCRMYGVPADRLLAEILAATGDGTVPEIELDHIERLGPSERALLSGFVQQVTSLRRVEGDDAISLRTGDIEVLASASGRTSEELLQIIRRTRR
jgi:transcriptional regulator with XRE-family HTH domain